MNIQRDEDFEKAYSEICKPIIARPYPRNEKGEYIYQEIHEAYLMWQAKAQVPEELVLIPKDSQFFEVKNHIEINFDEDREDDSHSYWGGYNQALRELKSIIEAQEDAELNEIADSRKDQKRISVNLDDL